MAKVNADSFQNHKSDRMKKSLEYSKCDSCKEYRRNWEKNKRRVYFYFFNIQCWIS